MSGNLAVNKTFHIFGDEKILTVSELSSAIKHTIENQFVAIKIRGEISGLKKHSSGHTYLSLKDNDSVINAICWRGTKISFPLQDGVEIIVKGRVSVYPGRSQYQFIIEEASIAGEGALLKLLNERKKHFAALGYFDRKRPIPKFPKIIGIVTSKTGAVLQDMRHRLEDRFPFCEVLVWSVNVQGEGSAEQVASAIRGFNFMTEKKPDVLIIARGGGSIEDLWPFNEEIVVRAVYESLIPTISAIGHETDTTLIDYASDLRAPTPTAAIELATPVLSELKQQIQENFLRISVFFKRDLIEKLTKISSMAKCLSSSQFAVLAIIQRFDDKIDRLQNSIKVFFQKESLKLKMKKMMSFESYFQLKKQRYVSHALSYDKLQKNYFSRYEEGVHNLSKRLEQGSFKKILEKGFCFITSQDGMMISTQLKFNDVKDRGVVIHFQDGDVLLKNP